MITKHRKVKDLYYLGDSNIIVNTQTKEFIAYPKLSEEHEEEFIDYIKSEELKEIEIEFEVL